MDIVVVIAVSFIFGIIGALIGTIIINMRP